MCIFSLNVSAQYSLVSLTWMYFSCRSGCNTKNYDIYGHKDVLIYKVLVMEEISLEDSDEEDSLAEDIDIDKLCEEMAKDSGLGSQSQATDCSTRLEEDCVIISYKECEVDKIGNTNPLHRNARRTPEPPQKIQQEEHEQFIVNPIALPPFSTFIPLTDSNSLKNASSTLKPIKELSVLVERLPQVLIDEHLQKRGKPQQDTEPERQDSWSKVLPSQKNIEDKNSDNDDAQSTIRKVEVDMELDPIRVQPGVLECVLTNNPCKIMIRRKSFAERDITLENPPKVLKVTCNSRDEETDKGCMPPLPLPLGEEKLLGSVATVKSNLPLRTPIPIIAPHTMPKKRWSLNEPKAQKLCTLASTQKVSSRKLPEEDMFTIGKKLQTEGPQEKSSILVGQYPSALSRQQLKEERNKKLRQNAEEKRLANVPNDGVNKVNWEKTESSPPIKVKNTEKNRGDFLTNMTSAPAPQKQSPVLPKPDLQYDQQESITSRMDAFRKKYASHMVSSVTVENGICNNLKFYDELDTSGLTQTRDD